MRGGVRIEVLGENEIAGEPAAGDFVEHAFRGVAGKRSCEPRVARQRQWTGFGAGRGVEEGGLPPAIAAPLESVDGAGGAGVEVSDLASGAPPSRTLAAVGIQNLELQGVVSFIGVEEEQAAVVGETLGQKSGVPVDRQEESRFAAGAVVQEDLGAVRIEVTHECDAIAPRGDGRDPKAGRRDVGGLGLGGREA